MEQKVKGRKKVEGTLDGFSFVSPPPYLWKSRRRPASRRNLDTVTAPTAETTEATPKKQDETTTDVKMQDAVTQAPELSERRKALFEPLEPINNSNGKRSSAEQLLPPPDFDSTNYPKGWLIGKKRKLVNVDVVESMRRIAVQEMNRKDREIDGLNEQLDEDARCLEHIQFQLLQEKSKRAEVERENAMLQEQITMLMNMLEETEEAAGNEENINEP